MPQAALAEAVGPAATVRRLMPVSGMPSSLCLGQRLYLILLRVTKRPMHILILLGPGNPTCWTDVAQAGDSEGEQSVPSSRRPVSQDRSPSDCSSSAETSCVLAARLPEIKLNALGSSSKAAANAGCACITSDQFTPHHISATPD